MTELNFKTTHESGTIRGADMPARTPDEVMSAAGDLRRAARWDEAIALLTALWRDSQDAKVAFELGSLFVEAGRLDDAYEWYSRSNAARPGTLAAVLLRELDDLLEYGGLLFGRGRASNPGRSVETLRRASHAALAAGRLDLNYYRKIYFSEKSDDEIFDEYIRCASFNGRTYSPNFDAMAYLQSNRDLIEHEIRPAEHHFEHGSAENRSIQHRLRQYSLIPDDDRLFLPSKPEPKEVRIAVHLHLYYPDYSVRFQRALSRFPVSFDLMISYSDLVSPEELDGFFQSRQRQNGYGQAC